MATIEKPPTIPDEDLAELEKAVQNLVEGIRDPNAMDRSSKRMDRMREEMRQRVGEGEGAVPLTRETRDEE